MKKRASFDVSNRSDESISTSINGNTDTKSTDHDDIEIEITNHVIKNPEVSVAKDNTIQNICKDEPKERFCQKLRRYKSYRQKFIQTVFLWWAGMICGWTSGQVGPSLLDLQIITQTSFEKISRLLTVGSVGFLVGSFSGGFLFSRLPSNVILFGSLFSNAVITAIIPWCIIYEVMLVAMFLRQVFLGASDTVINAELLYIWRHKNRSYMQALHFAFAFGGIVSPLATAPFLLPTPDTTSGNSSINEVISNVTTYEPGLQFSNILDYTVLNLTKYAPNILKKHKLSKIYSKVTDSSVKNNNSLHSSSTSRIAYQIATADPSFAPHMLNITSATSASVLLTESRIFIAYVISAFLSLSCSAVYLFLVIKTRTRKRKLSRNETESNAKKDCNSRVNNLPLLTRVMVLVTMMVLIGVYNAIEESFAGFVTTFTVKQLSWSKSIGSIAASVFWATFGGGRFLGIFMIRLCSPACMIDMYGIFSIISFIGLLISALTKCNTGIWICIVLVGFSLSVFSPTIFTWTEELTHVTGKVASGLKIAANTGSMINSVVLGIVMDRLSPLWFCYLLLGECVFIFILCIFATIFSRKLKGKVASQTFQIDVIFPSDKSVTKL